MSTTVPKHQSTHCRPWLVGRVLLLVSTLAWRSQETLAAGPPIRVAEQLAPRLQDASSIALLVAVLSWVLPPALRSVRGHSHVRYACIASACISFALGRALAGDGPIVPVIAAALGTLAALRSARRSAVRSQSAVDPDDPIQTHEQDLFGRGDMATYCLRLLTNPAVKCPRIAVAGGYGHGKSSVAMLVREKANVDNHLFVRFDPWHHRQDAQAALDALIVTIEQAIGDVSGATWLRLQIALRQTVSAVLAKNEWAAGIRSPVEHFLNVSNNELSQRLAARLAGKRLIIFVDDLERCTPEVIERLLTSIKERFNVHGLAFLIAMHIDAISSRLSSAGDLLDKVLDEKVLLPPPPAAALHRIDEQTLEGSPLWADYKDALLQISNLLPQSARMRKRFLQRLHSLPAPLTGVPPELMRDVLLALLVMDFECPGCLREMLSDELALDDLESGAVVAKALSTDDGDSASSLRIERAWLTHPTVKAAYTWIRNERGFSRKQSVHTHVHWLLTGKLPAYVELNKCLDGLPDDAQPATWLQALAVFTRGDLTACNRALVSYRQRLLNQAADETSHAEQQRILQRARRASESRRELLPAILVGPRDAAKTFEIAVTGFLKWVHFGGPYRAAHDAEWQVVCAEAEHPGEDTVHRYLALSSIRENAFMEKPIVKHAFASVKARVRGQLASFMAICGTTELLRATNARDESERGYRMALDLAPELARKLANSECTDEQSWEYARILLRKILREQRTEGTGVGELAQSLWAYLTANRLNRRTVGSLEELVAVWEGQNSAKLPRPAWWEEVMAETEQQWMIPNDATTIEA